MQSQSNSLTFKVPVEEGCGCPKAWHHHHGLVQVLLLRLLVMAAHLQCVQVMTSTQLDKPVIFTKNDKLITFCFLFGLDKLPKSGEERSTFW